MASSYRQTQRSRHAGAGVIFVGYSPVAAKRHSGPGWIAGAVALFFEEMLGQNFNQMDSVANLRDITEQKKLETHLRKAPKMQAVGRLAAGVAHEINNQLTRILTTAMLLQKDIDFQDSIFPLCG